MIQKASACGLIQGLVAVLSVFVGQACAAPAEPSAEEDIRQADVVAATRDALGARLLKCLADDQQPIELRLLSATALGRLRYSPAIPTLIQLIDLAASKPQGETTLEPYSCFMALTNFGVAVVPKTIEAYLREKHKPRQALLLLVLSKGKILSEARIYSRGIATTRDDPAAAQAAESLARLLESM